MRARMQSNATGRRLLRERPRVTGSRISVDGLRRLPKESFGYAYSQVSPPTASCPPNIYTPKQFLDLHGFAVDRPPVLRGARVTCDV